MRSKLHYGCIVYGLTRNSYLRMLEPVQNHALKIMPWSVPNFPGIPYQQCSDSFV